MDITVTQKADEVTWQLTDLLGRPMGEVAEVAPGAFRIVAVGHALETMKVMKHGPFLSLGTALAEIERFTRSACQRVSEKDQGMAKRPDRTKIATAE
ncbi:hypothetical protein [Bosea sp. BK604]|uniref:hypothetical protein n=1 Tax=Bosea sp. BK604 TaxID=2512180 RepID=UPI001051F30E|nr:hypothetical protein [Bosea sp. BK604]TCR63465.1 hypothetical protein EV560_108112 [Bosea sp. BK604]